MDDKIAREEVLLMIAEARKQQRQADADACERMALAWDRERAWTESRPGACAMWWETYRQLAAGCRFARDAVLGK